MTETPDGFPNFRPTDEEKAAASEAKQDARIRRNRDWKARAAHKPWPGGGGSVWSTTIDPPPKRTAKAKGKKKPGAKDRNSRGRTPAEQTAYNELRSEILIERPPCMAPEHAPSCRGRANALQHIIPKRAPYNGPDVRWNLLPVDGGMVGSGVCNQLIDTKRPGDFDAGPKHGSDLRSPDGRPGLWIEPAPDGGWISPPWG